MAIKITKGNKSDLSAISTLIKGLKGKLFTGIRKNMKNHLLELEDKNLSRKRVLIESVFNVLKNHMNLEHTRP